MLSSMRPLYRDRDVYWVRECVVATGRARGGSPFPSTAEDWADRIAGDLARLTDLLSPASNSTSTPDDGEGLRNQLDQIEGLLTLATFFPLGEHLEALRGLDAALRSRKAALGKRADALLREERPPTCPRARSRMTTSCLEMWR